MYFYFKLLLIDYDFVNLFTVSTLWLLYYNFGFSLYVYFYVFSVFAPFNDAAVVLVFLEITSKFFYDALVYKLLLI